jgi:hypothetical protein
VHIRMRRQLASAKDPQLVRHSSTSSAYP